MQQANNQEIEQIHSLVFTDSKLVDVNFRHQVDFEDLSEMIDAGQLMEGASVIFVAKNNSLAKFHKRVNYLFFNSMLYIKHDRDSHKYMNKNEDLYECYRVGKYR
jgi:hypothetical protein